MQSHALDAIQFHGDEPPEALAEFAEYFRIRVFRLRPDKTGEIADYLSRCASCNCLPDAVLVDAWQDQAYGGTGVTADWELVAQQRALFGSLPFILAGGLNPSNVAQAIAVVRPDAVDVASGVERTVGVKDKRKTADFISRAQAAFRA
jgi:phosphoribosylanthranilate isomerase